MKTLLHSNVLKEDRELWIHLPESYNNKNKYPVLYLLDCKENFIHTLGTLDVLTSAGMIPELIIVGIVNTNRTRDFTPTVDVKRESSGGGEKFLDFIEAELIPHIDTKYRTENFKIFAGHSLGGLLVLHSFQSRPNLFQAHFAFSPALYWNNKATVENTKAFLMKTKTLSNFIYMNLGDEGLGKSKGRSFDMREGFIELAAFLKESSIKGFSSKTDLYENEVHMTTPIIGQLTAYRSLYSQWELSWKLVQEGGDAIDKHYQALSMKFGYKILPPENRINQAAYYFLQTAKDLKTAFKFFELNVRNFPESSNTYDSLADAYVENGQFNQAIKQIRLAIKHSKNLERKTFYKSREKKFLDLAMTTEN